MNRYRPLLLTLLLLAPACSESRELTVTGIQLEFDDTVQWRQVTQSATGQATTAETTVNGMQYSLENGVLKLGDHSFPGLVSGDHIVLGADGIVVNGERRWDFPK